jgi:hypothetical protein
LEGVFVVEQKVVDARAARLAARMYLRWLWLPMVAVVVGYFVGGVLSEDGSADARSDGELTFGLTSEVRWPFYDAVLERQAGLLDDAAIPEAATAETGVPHEQVRVTRTNEQNSTFTIEFMVAGSADDAEAFADALGRLLVEANRSAERTAYLSEVALLQDELAVRQGEIAVLQEELQSAVGRRVVVEEAISAAEGDTSALRGESTLLDIERQEIKRRLDGFLELEASILTRLSEAEFAAETSGSNVEVSAPAAVEFLELRDLRAVGAVVFLLLSLLLVPVLDQRFGRVTSIDQLGQLWPQSKILDGRNTKRSRGLGPISMARLALVGTADAAGASVAIASTAPSADAELIAQDLSHAGHEVAMVGVDSPADLDTLVHSDAAVLVVPTRSLRLGVAADLASELALLSSEPDLVVLGRRADGGCDRRAVADTGDARARLG